MSRISFALLLLALAARAQEPEPGLIESDLVDPGELVIPPVQGDAKEAHKTFLATHEAHVKGDLDAALKGYLKFLGMRGHHELPSRYTRIVRTRLEAMHEQVKLKYMAAMALYSKDRAKGLVEMKMLLVRYPMLPEGKSARLLVHSDTTRDAVRKARDLAEAGTQAQAARDLEAAIRSSPDSLFLYEARKLLVDLGGPDLRDPEDRIGSEDGGNRPRRGGGDGEESVIEIGDAPPKKEAGK